MQTGVGTSEVLLFPECIELLEAAAEDGLIGRLAVSTDKAPIVEPVAFDYEDRAIVVHPGGGMLADSAPGSLVAFEVDYVDMATLDAWTVLVRGLATSRDETHQSRTPLDLLRAGVQVNGTRLLVVRLDVVTGRRFVLESPKPRPGQVSAAVAQAISGAARSGRP